MSVDFTIKAKQKPHGCLLPIVLIGFSCNNDSNPQYSYYYGFRISHYIDKNYWILETDYAAYGGREAEWAESTLLHGKLI